MITINVWKKFRFRNIYIIHFHGALDSWNHMRCTGSIIINYDINQYFCVPLENSVIWWWGWRKFKPWIYMPYAYWLQCSSNSLKSLAASSKLISIFPLAGGYSGYLSRNLQKTQRHCQHIYEYWNNVVVLFDSLTFHVNFQLPLHVNCLISIS